MSCKWQQLHLSRQDLPPLLFQYTQTHQSYALYVTDLTSIWAEQLSKTQVLERADESATTIDPSEDLEQLELLLTKIGEALHGQGGTASIYTGSQADIEIATSSKLPAPLRPLKWNFLLSQKSASALTEQILLPLLKDEASWEARQRLLLDQLKQKDWALARLLDKVEALGVDLATVFPSVSRRRNPQNTITREEVAKFVNGIKPVDESPWLVRPEDGRSTKSSLSSDLVQALVGTGSPENLENLTPSQHGWWHALQHRQDSFSPDDDKNGQASKNTSFTESRTEFPQNSQGDVDLDISTASEDDEFERQDTPPHLKARQFIAEPEYQTKTTKTQATSPRTKPKAKAPSPKPTTLDAGESTASESDQDLEPRRAISPPRIGKSKPKSPSLVPPAPEAGESTPSESGCEPSPIPKQASPQIRPSTISPLPPPPKTPTRQPDETPSRKPRRVLGVIGGRKKKDEAPPLPSLPQQEPISPDAPKESRNAIGSAVSQSSPAKSKRPMKLGTIGGKAKSKTSDMNEASASNQPSTSSSPRAKLQQSSNTNLAEISSRAVTSVEPKKEHPANSPKQEDPSSGDIPETEDQKADRKREELKRQLAEKSKAPKKKRKF